MITAEKIASITKVIGDYTAAIKLAISTTNSTTLSYSVALTAEDLKVSMGLGESMTQVLANGDRFVLGADRKLNSANSNIYERWSVQRPPLNVLRSLGIDRTDTGTVTQGKFARGIVSKENELVGSDSDYQFEVTLSGPSIRGGTGSDKNFANGAAGLVIGYVANTDGTIDYLSVVRHTGDWGTKPKFGLYLNVIDFDTPNVPLVGTSSGLTETDWGSLGVKIRVTLTGDTLTLETTLPGSSTYVTAAKLTYTYTADTTLQKIKKSRRFGYMLVGEVNGNGNDFTIVDQLYTWTPLLRQTTTVPIMDLVNNVVYKYANNAWAIESGKTPTDYLKPLKQYLSIGTRKLIYTDQALAGYWLR